MFCFGYSFWIIVIGGQFRLDVCEVKKENKYYRVMKFNSHYTLTVFGRWILGGGEYDELTPADITRKK